MIRKTIYTRIVLIEKNPLRIKINFTNINKCKYWYKDQYGEIFDVMKMKLRNNSDQIVYRVLNSEQYGFFIDGVDCKILSGV